MNSREKRTFQRWAGSRDSFHIWVPCLGTNEWKREPFIEKLHKDKEKTSQALNSIMGWWDGMGSGRVLKQTDHLVE